MQPALQRMSRPSRDYRAHSCVMGDQVGGGASQQLGNTSSASAGLNEELALRDAESRGAGSGTVPGNGRGGEPEVTATPPVAQGTRNSAGAVGMSGPGEVPSTAAGVSRRRVSFRTESRLAAWGMDLDQADETDELVADLQGEPAARSDLGVESTPDHDGVWRHQT